MPVSPALIVFIVTTVNFLESKKRRTEENAKVIIGVFVILIHPGTILFVILIHPGTILYQGIGHSFDWLLAIGFFLYYALHVAGE